MLLVMQNNIVAVTFDDDTPKSGRATIHLTIPKMDIKKSFFGKAEPKNATINHMSFDNE